MPSPCELHPPFQRIISDEANAIDRQWLRMLSDVFHETTYEQLVEAGMTRDGIRDFLGTIALNRRINGE